jgi:hypothetical protein
MDSHYATAREEGKGHFKAKRFEEALCSYTRALHDMGTDIVTHSKHSAGSDTIQINNIGSSVSGCLTNRAVCRVKLNDWQGACRDAAAAITVTLHFAQTPVNTLQQQEEQQQPPNSSALPLSKPLYSLGKALYQLGNERAAACPSAAPALSAGGAAGELYADSLAALQFLSVMDASDQEGRKLAAIVSGKIAVCRGIDGREEEEQDGGAVAAPVSPSRMVVRCSFLAPTTDRNSDGGGVAASVPPR